MVGHGREPDVDVEAKLMAGMSCQQRAAARLGHVVDEESAPAVSRRLLGQLFDELGQLRVAPVC